MKFHFKFLQIKSRKLYYYYYYYYGPCLDGQIMIWVNQQPLRTRGTATASVKLCEKLIFFLLSISLKITFSVLLLQLEVISSKTLTGLLLPP